jgi:hypothetical protein
MPDQPVAEDPLPLNSPYCGRPLSVRLSDRDAGRQCVCPVQGEFKIDATGRLPDVLRALERASPQGRTRRTAPAGESSPEIHV